MIEREHKNRDKKDGDKLTEITGDRRIPKNKNRDRNRDRGRESKGQDRETRIVLKQRKNKAGFKGAHRGPFLSTGWVFRQEREKKK